MGEDPRRLCLAVARFASISAFSWLYLIELGVDYMLEIDCFN